MREHYEYVGKQVFHDGTHFCDAVSSDVAQKAVAMLNASEEVSALSYAEAVRVGARLREIVSPSAWYDELLWADVVQTTLRLARAEIAFRGVAA